MAFRGNESPMDFQWEKHGPADPSSPFHKFAMANDKKRKRETTDPKSIFANLTLSEGSHTTLTSPGKNNFPALREPNGLPYFLNSQPKDAPTSPYRNPSFTTPRKNYDIDFSSGPESSPVVPADDDTPDGKPLPAVPGSKSKSKSKRNSLFNFYGRFAPSASKSETKKPATDVLAKRVYKKRRQAQTFERQLALARRESEDASYSDSDAPDTTTVVTTTTRSRRNNTTKRKPSQKDLPPLPAHQQPIPPSQSQPGMLASTISFIHAHPNAPSIIAKYFQVLFNGIILLSCLFVLYSFYTTIRADIAAASDDAYAAALADSVACQKHFIDNRCNMATRLPALEAACTSWELCMGRDPGAVRRASLSAATFAEIFNSFVEPISVKTMVFSVVVVAVALVISNGTFMAFRRAEERRVGDLQHQQYLYQHQHAQAQSGVAMYSGGQPMGQLGMYQQTPQQQLQYAWKQGENESDAGGAGYEQQSPSKSRGRNGSPQKKKVMVEHQ